MSVQYLWICIYHLLPVGEPGWWSCASGVYRILQPPGKPPLNPFQGQIIRLHTIVCIFTFFKNGFENWGFISSAVTWLPFADVEWNHVVQSFTDWTRLCYSNTWYRALFWLDLGKLRLSWKWNWNERIFSEHFICTNLD